MTSTLLLFTHGQLRRRIGTLVAQEAKKIGLGSKQLTIVRTLFRETECSPSRLAEQTDSDLPTVSRSLNALFKKGWIRRTSDTDDRRKQGVRLTAKGIKKSQELDGTIQQLADRVYSCLDAKEKTDFLRLQEKIIHSLADIGSEEGC